MVATSPRDSFSKRRRASLVFLYFAFALTGLANGLLTGMSAENLHPDLFIRVQLITACLLSLGSMWFCTADARLVGKPLIQLAKLGIFLGWPVGVPIYLLWARGIRGFAHLLVYGVSLILVAVVAFAVGAFAYFSPFH